MIERGPGALFRPGNAGGVGEWLIPPGCKPGALTGFAGSNPAPATSQRQKPT